MEPKKEQALAGRPAQKEALRRPVLPPPDPSKVIFLDVDGVIRPMGSSAFDKVMVDGEFIIDRRDTADFIPGALLSLRHIVEQTGAMIVLSSEWRRIAETREAVDKILREYEMPTSASWTRTDLERWTRQGVNLLGEEDPERNFTRQRAREISDWLKTNPQVKQWVVLDPFDLSLADADRRQGVMRMQDRLVQTQHRVGLRLQDGKAAVQLMRGERPAPKVDGANR